MRLRLQRFGLRNNPFYRIVAADSRWPRDGKHIEMLGDTSAVNGTDVVWCGAWLRCGVPSFTFPKPMHGAVHVPESMNLSVCRHLQPAAERA